MAAKGIQQHMEGMSKINNLAFVLPVCLFIQLLHEVFLAGSFMHFWTLTQLVIFQPFQT